MLIKNKYEALDSDRDSVCTIAIIVNYGNWNDGGFYSWRLIKEEKEITNTKCL